MTRARGFTLLEVLIALGLISIIMVILFSSLRTASKAWDAVDRAVYRLDEERRAQRFLNDRLSRAVMLRLKTGRGNPVAFAGDDEHLSFVTSLFEFLEYGGIYAVDLYYKADGKALMLRFAPFDPSHALADQFDQAREDTLLEQVDSLHFNYLDKRGNWNDEWHENRPPKLVRIAISAADKTWPDMLIAVPSV